MSESYSPNAGTRPAARRALKYKTNGKAVHSISKGDK